MPDVVVSLVDSLPLPIAPSLDDVVTSVFVFPLPVPVPPTTLGSASIACSVPSLTVVFPVVSVAS